MFIELFNFSVFSITGWGIDLDYCLVHRLETVYYFNVELVILNGLPWKQTDSILLFLPLHPSTAFWTLVDYDGYCISSKGFFSPVGGVMVI